MDGCRHVTTPAPLTLPAPPKVNLRLLVGPRRDDGYHPLRTLMVALDGPVDRVTVSRADARRVTCPGIAGPANLAWAALDALQEEMDDALPPLAVDPRSRQSEKSLENSSHRPAQCSQRKR